MKQTRHVVSGGFCFLEPSDLRGGQVTILVGDPTKTGEVDLKGSKPGDLPIAVRQVRVVINLKAAKALGLTIPPSLLQLADRVIEEE